MKPKMKPKMKRAFFYLAATCLIVAAVLVAFYYWPDATSPAPDETEVKPPFYIAGPTPPAEEVIITYPQNPAPGDFLVLEASPIPGEAEIVIDFDFPGTVSEHYHVGNFFYALIAISYDSEPGVYDITVRADNTEADKRTFQTGVVVAEKEFQTSRFSMPARVTEGWTAERLAEERERIKEARETSEAHPLWTNGFSLPLEGRITSEYGAIRIINNNPPRRHAGLDIAAETGTPIISTNRGIVRLADHLLSGGKTVIIDHGLGLSSTYMHLDSITVEEGQLVEQEAEIGTVGMTGYATGPHLHWEVNLSQNPVNPVQLLDKNLLWIPPAYVARMLSRER